MLRQARESINIITMLMSQMDIAIMHRKIPHQNSQCAMITQANQTPHLLKIKFKLDPKKNPQWSRHFVDLAI